MPRILESALATTWPVRSFDMIDSTNSEAARLIEAGELGPLWIVADQQTNGRGRRGKHWTSLAGNLFATALFTFDADFRLASKLSFAIALAIHDTIYKLGINTDEFMLKWPNDIRVRGRKISGILVEAGRLDDERLWIVAGVGVNISQAPEDVDQPTARLCEFQEQLTRDTFFAIFTKCFNDRILSLVRYGFAPIRLDWLKHCENKNKQVTIFDGGISYTGTLVDIDEDGAAVVRLGNGLNKKFVAGELNT